MSGLPSAPACERNKGPILEVLRRELADRQSVLEIGSGTGQHAVHFASALPHLCWHTSDLPESHSAILAWIGRSKADNVRAPLSLDVRQPDMAVLSALGMDAVFSANTAHIMSIEAVAGMFGLVGRLLPPGGIFCLYGPFNFDGCFSSDSNEEFDASLRQRNPAMGIRDLETLDELAAGAGLARARLYAMPANNHLAVWMKGGTGGTGSRG